MDWVKQWQRDYCFSFTTSSLLLFFSGSFSQAKPPLFFLALLWKYWPEFWLVRSGHSAKTTHTHTHTKTSVAKCILIYTFTTQPCEVTTPTDPFCGYKITWVCPQNCLIYLTRFCKLGLSTLEMFWGLASGTACTTSIKTRSNHPLPRLNSTRWMHCAFIETSLNKPSVS